MKHLPFFVLIALLCLAEAAFSQTREQAPTRSNGPFSVAFYQGAKWRSIGPYRGGRCVAVEGVPDEPQTYYMGTTGGGVWKTTDAGLTWSNISDGYFLVGSIGAIAVSPSDPNIVYVGTGEHAVRGVMTSHGDGIYKSDNAGRTWTHLGLPNSRHIASITIHPTNPNILYVAVQGTSYGPSADRGIYRSIDGGQTWEHLFFTDDYTGAADLSMDTNNPRILYASMWDHHRQPWQIRSGGDWSGLYKSTDGGTNWQRMQNGLPEKMGKAGIAVSPANSDVVYANIEADKGGVFRSTDAGNTWTQVNADRVTFARAWYYMEIVPDPKDENIVYVLNAPLLRSTDGGRNFASVPNPHTDQHDLWINPRDPKNIILGNDGGACVSFNGGKSWSSQMNQPTGQFYRAIADNRYPYYYIYGGQQDYSAIAIPSSTYSEGISEKDWYEVAGGESAFVAFDADNPQLVYGGGYQGNIAVFNQQTRETKDIMAYPTVGLATLPKDMKYRFNWNAPIVANPHDPRIIYHAAQKVLVTRDGGNNWQSFSPDLTRNEAEKQGLGGVPFINEGAGGENYNTISYLACSPHDPWVLWVGTDDGLVQLTRDEGQTWKNVTPPDLGEALINCIEVSRHNPSTAYVVATRYKFDDFQPYIFKTTDFGKTWTTITYNIAPDDFVRVVREDPTREGLLYAGTETGLYISYNSGRVWHRFQLNLPICPINDLVIQRNDLIAATSGRGFWVLDDLSFLQQSAGFLLARNPQVFRPKQAYRMAATKTVASSTQGQNALGGMIIDYYLPAQAEGQPVTLEILDENGIVIRDFSSVKDPQFKAFPGGPPEAALLPAGFGIRRFNWDLRRNSVRSVDGVFVHGNYEGALVPPGRYTLRLKVGTQVVEESAEVLPDPRIKVGIEAYREQARFLSELENTVSDIHASVEMMMDLRSQMRILIDRLGKLNDQPELVKKAASIVTQIDAWEAQLVQPQQKTFQDVINFPNRLNAELLDLHARCDGADPVITNGALMRRDDLQAEWQALAIQRDTIIYSEMAAFNKLYAEKQLPVLFLPPTTPRTAW